MATAEELQALYRVAPQGEFDGVEVGALLDSVGFNATAARLWAAYAQSTVTLVDVSESGSSRKMSDIHKNAKAMSEVYAGLARAEEVEVSTTVNVARSRRMTR